MNEIMKCVETLRELLRDQIVRNTDLHLTLSRSLAEVNEARRERDDAWEELSRVRKELAASNLGAERNAHINNSLCSKLIQAERERDSAWGEVGALKAKMKEEA